MVTVRIFAADPHLGQPADPLTVVAASQTVAAAVVHSIVAEPPTVAVAPLAAAAVVHSIAAEPPTVAVASFAAETAVVHSIAAELPTAVLAPLVVAAALPNVAPPNVDDVERRYGRVGTH